MRSDAEMSWSQPSFTDREEDEEPLIVLYFSVQSVPHTRVPPFLCCREATAGVDVTAKTRVLVAVTAEVGAAAVCAGIYRWSAATRRLKIECYTACIRATDAAPGEGGDRRWALQ